MASRSGNASHGHGPTDRRTQASTHQQTNGQPENITPLAPTNIYRMGSSILLLGLLLSSVKSRLGLPFWYRLTRVVPDRGLLNVCVCGLLHPFNGLFSRATRVSRYQKVKTSLDLDEARDDGVLGWQWHQLDHMQTICTSLQTDNHTNTSSLDFYRPDVLLGARPTKNQEVSKH